MNWTQRQIDRLNNSDGTVDELSITSHCDEVVMKLVQSSKSDDFRMEVGIRGDIPSLHRVRTASEVQEVLEKFKLPEYPNVEATLDFLRKEIIKITQSQIIKLPGNS